MQLRALVLVLLSVPAMAQFDGLLPNVRQTFTNGYNGGSANTVTTQDSIKSGDVLGACVYDEGSSSVYTPSSTPSESWSKTVTYSVSAGGDNESVAIIYTTAHSNGPYTINVSSSTTSTVGIQPFELKNASINLDGSPVDAKCDGSGGCTNPATLNIPLTTSVNGSTVVACFQDVNTFAGAVWEVPYPNQYLSNGTFGGFGAPFMVGLYTGLAGSYNVQNRNLNSVVTFGQAIAFQPPSGIKVVTTEMPKADTVSAYSATLAAVGGSGAYTWALTGTVPGLSFNTATGVFSGTATTPGTYSLSVTATDGTLTSPSIPLTIIVVSAFTTPSIVQSKVCFTGTPPSCTFTSPVSRGNHEIIIVKGQNTHGTIGWFSSEDNISSTSGLLFRQIPQFSVNSSTSDLMAFESTTPIVSCSSDTIHFTVPPSGVTGSNLEWIIAEVANTQSAIDTPVGNNTFHTEPFTGTFPLTTTYPIPVANELLLGFSVGNDTVNLGTVTAVSIGSPWSSIFAGGSGAANDQTAISSLQTTTVGSYNEVATATVSAGSSGKAGLATYVLPLRPDVSTGSSCTLVPHHVTVL